MGHGRMGEIALFADIEKDAKALETLASPMTMCRGAYPQGDCGVSNCRRWLATVRRGMEVVE
jgi:hypothetical protein